MKLAVDALNLLNDGRGMGRYVRHALRDLAARDDLSLTLLVRDADRAAEYRAIAGPNTRVAELAGAAKRGAYDVVWYPWNALRFPAHAPTLVTINDDFAFRYPARGFVARYREQVPIRRGIKRATRIATISAWSREAISARFRLDPDTIALIPLAPDPLFVPGIEHAAFGEKFVLAVGSGEVRKNISFLTDVMTRAFPEGDVRFVLVGTLDARSRQRVHRARIPLTEVAGIDDSSLRTLYRTATLTAVPSLAEGFGLVAAEALACGSSVIAANTSALPEAVGDAGVLLDPRFADAWVDALRSIVRDPLLNATLRARAAARWSASAREQMTPAIERLLRSLCA